MNSSSVASAPGGSRRPRRRGRADPAVRAAAPGAEHRRRPHRQPAWAVPRRAGRRTARCPRPAGRPRRRAGRRERPGRPVLVLPAARPGHRAAVPAARAARRPGRQRGRRGQHGRAGPPRDAPPAGRADPGAPADRARSRPVLVPRPAPRLRGRAGAVGGQRGRAARGHGPDAGSLPAHRARGVGLPGSRPAAGHAGRAPARRDTGAHRRHRAGAGLVRARRPGPDGRGRAGRGSRLRRVRVADHLGAVQVPESEGPLA